MPGRHWQWRLEVNFVDNRRTFVLWISRPPVAAADPCRVVLAGHLEEVDTGRDERFRSTEQLVAFLERYMAADARQSAHLEESSRERT